MVLTSATAAAALSKPAKPGKPLHCAPLAKSKVPVYRADGTLLGHADQADLRTPGFVASIATVARRVRDGAIRRLYLKARPGEVCRMFAEDSQACVRDGRGYSHHEFRCAAYASDPEAAIAQARETRFGNQPAKMTEGLLALTLGVKTA